MKILINAVSTKRHAGGAFQIACNFLVRSLHDSSVEWFYLVSEDVDNTLKNYFTSIKNERYFVFPTQPDFKNTYRNVSRQIHQLEDNIKPDVVYSIAAPSYLFFKTREVMRFTNPWVTHPNKFSWSVFSFKNRLKIRVRCSVLRFLMRKCRYFITQTETTKKGILRITKTSSENVCVVQNVLPAVYKTMDNSHLGQTYYIDVACIGNPTPHKNFDIIPIVLKELKRMGVSNVRFHTTIPKEHALYGRFTEQLKKEDLLECWVNHGRISQHELGGVYRQCSFCFFPSLLEVFSASILEAMFYGLPILASDFPFNKDVLDDACLYFEPKNATNAAEQLKKMIIDKDLQHILKKRMEKRISMYSDYDKHFNSIVDFLKKVGNREI